MMFTTLPASLTTLLLLTLTPTLASPSPPYLPLASQREFTSLIPRHTLFFRQAPPNLQSFSAALGGFAASAIENSGDAKRPFRVDGDTFPDFDTAAQRTCDNQFQKCSQSANGAGKSAGLTVEGCTAQKEQCLSAQKSASVKDFNAPIASTNIGPDPAFPDFDLICDA